MPYGEYAECPNCGKTAHDKDEIEELFGYRKMCDGRIIPQTWCRECRSNYRIPQPRWKEVEYSRNQIIKAGKTIKSDNVTDELLKQAIIIVDNWREAHAFPLHVIYINLRRIAQKYNNVIVAERLKRLDSIISKLKRQPSMSLWTMQDLGGCRLIVPNIDDVYFHAQNYEQSRKRHVLLNTYDYIKHPKSSGYRSLHLVYQYHSDNSDKYNKNMLIEIQIRTHLQHLWATAVETMGLFTKESIKSGQGSDDIKRFFVLVSSLFAIRENQPLVPNTVNEISELVSELEGINSRNNYLDFLSAIRVAIDNQENNIKNEKGYYILILNYNTKRLTIKHFKTSEIEEANAIYASIESTRAESKIDAVLVRVSSFKALKSAYPNYFSDIKEFVDIVKEYLK